MTRDGKKDSKSTRQNQIKSYYDPNLMKTIADTIVSSSKGFGGDKALELATACFILNMMCDQNFKDSKVTDAMHKLELERNIIDVLPVGNFTYPGSVYLALSKLKRLAASGAYHEQLADRLLKKLETKKLSEEEQKELTIIKGRNLLNELTETMGVLDENTGRSLSVIEEKIAQHKKENLTHAEKRRTTRTGVVDDLMNVVLHTLGTKSEKLETLTEGDSTHSSPKLQATLKNCQEDIKNSLVDFVTIFHETVLENEETNMSYKMKLSVIKEFVESINKKYFNDLALCRRMDKSLKMNVGMLEELIPLLNFYSKDSDKCIDDLTNNGGIPGGAQNKRYNQLCSRGQLMKMKRSLEALAVKLFGAAVTEDNVGAQIDLEKFINLFAKRFNDSLDRTKDFDEKGVCKYILCFDITNDGMAWGHASINIAGLKIYPIEIGKDSRTLKPVHALNDKTICIPLSVFINKDNKDNLDAYHGRLYRIIKNKIKNIVEVKINESDTVKFMVKYALSGDFKSHALACGLCNLTGTSVTDYMFCCSDVHSDSLCLAEVDICHWCVECNKATCRHKPYIRFRWTLPKRYQQYQSILNVYKTEFEVIQREIRNEQLAAQSQEQPGSSTTAAKKSSRKRSQEQLRHTIISPLYCINPRTSKDHNAEEWKWQARRLSEYSQDLTTDAEVALFLEQEYKMRKVTLQKIGPNSNDKSTVAVSIENATLEEMQHHLRIRLCHNRLEVEQYLDETKYIDLNQYLIDLFHTHYNFDVDKSIVTSKDITFQTRELLRIVLLNELYVLYFRKEAEKTQNKALVDDKLLLIVCDLHMEMRIGLTLLERLINSCIQSRYKSEIAASLRMKLENWINSEVFRTPGTGTSNYHFPIVKDECQPITLTNVSLVKILNNIDGFIDRIIAFDNEKFQRDTKRTYLKNKQHNLFNTIEQYRTIIKGFTELMRQLRAFKNSNTDADYINWQINVVDPWVESYLQLFGWNKVGYYVHYLMRGHVCEQLIHFKNIHCHSQQNWEGLVGIIKKYLASHTQHGGNSSGGKAGMGSKQQEPLNVALLRLMLRLSLFALYPNDKDLRDLLALHKEELQNMPGIKGATKVSSIDDLDEQDDDHAADENDSFQRMEIGRDEFDVVLGTVAVGLLTTSELDA